MAKNNDKYDVIVIGGGASGMMAGGRAGELGKRVLILEKNAELGKKLKITGGGRCNIANAEYDEHVLLGKYGQAKSFLYSAFSQFGVKNTFEFFESRGLPLVVQANKRAFPKSEKALDVFLILEKYLKSNNVEARTNMAVERFNISNGRIESVIANGQTFSAKSFIIATGGKSHPETGSTGDGFGWLKHLGHNVKDPSPSIVPLMAREKWIKNLAGTKLSAVKIIFLVDGVRKIVLKGDILCTHFGLSGPLILNISHKVRDLLHEGSVTAQIDLYPSEDIGALDKRITTVFDQNKNKTLKNIWNDIAPLGSGHALLPLLSKFVEQDIKVHSITKEQRRYIVDLLKALPLSITGLMGYDRAVVADGGLILEEIDMRTMCSNIISNLYITGDLLNISRPSGGYSLQLCWTTGYIAGSNA